MSSKILVVGHRNPDNDSIAAAVGLSLIHISQVVTFDAGVDALMELNSERAQAAIVDEPRYLRYVQVKEPHLQAVETIASDKDYAFVVVAGNDELLATVNEALAALRADAVSYTHLDVYKRQDHG